MLANIPLFMTCVNLYRVSHVALSLSTSDLARAVKPGIEHASKLQSQPLRSCSRDRKASHESAILLL